MGQRGHHLRVGLAHLGQNRETRVTRKKRLAASVSFIRSGYIYLIFKPQLLSPIGTHYEKFYDTNETLAHFPHIHMLSVRLELSTL